MSKLICPALGVLVLGAMGYCAWLSSDFGSVLACAPAILVLVAVVVGFSVGVMFFGRAELPAGSALVLEPVRLANGRGSASERRSIYNERKLRGIFQGVTEIPEKHARKGKRPREVAQVVEAACTGCGVCIPFCPTDCIELEPAANRVHRSMPAARVRYDECSGCGICVRVCETLAWDATVMRPTPVIEREEGIVIHDTPWDRDGSGF